jgi:putative ABC transport system permease protein
MPPGRQPFVDRLLRVLVRLLPADFRGDFGRAIDADLAERRSAGDRAGLLRRELPGLLGAVVREHADGLLQDLKHALRLMKRTPGFTALAVLMLALGTGVNVAMFSVIDAVLLRSPFTDPERIVEVHQLTDGQPAAIEPDRFAALAAGAHPFAALAAYDFSAHLLTGSGDARNVPLECVSASMFDVLGARPMLGRPFGREDDQPGAPATIVLGFELWRELGGSVSLLGTTLRVNYTPVTIIGVMPRGFGGPFSRPRSRVEGWVPLGRPLSGEGHEGCAAPFRVNALARLQDGVTIDAARRRLSGFGLNAHADYISDRVGTPLYSLAAAVACVLLIACLNVGGLQLERLLARRHEMAIRTALGASRGRLARQALTESLVLGLAGAAAGLAATWLTLRALVSLLPASLPHRTEIALNERVLVVALGAAVLASMVASLFPVRQLRHVRPGADLVGTARSGRRLGGATRRGLVIAEVALSVLVLIGAGLMIQTFLTLRPSQPGFESARKTMGRVRLPKATPADGLQFADALLERLSAAPGIRGAAVATILPMRGLSSHQAFEVNGSFRSVNTYRVSAGYFELMRMPLIAGRSISADDRAGAPAVVVVNQAFAERLRPDGRVLGGWIAMKPSRGTTEGPAARQIVGVVANTRSTPQNTRVVDEAFVPFAQQPTTGFFVVAESAGGPDAAVAAELQTAVRTLRPDLAVDELESMTSMVDRGVEQWRFGAYLLGIFAALAVVLAAVGHMTTIGWWVRQRTREVGVRLALGAGRGEIGRLVMRQGLALAGAGIALGCLLAAALTRYMTSWIYGVTPLDPQTFALCAGGMLAIAIAATLLPLRAATSVDPVVALRAE